MTTTYQSLRDMHPRAGGQEHLGMRSLIAKMDFAEDPLVVPDYQRARVWTDEQCSKFIGFIAEGGEAPPLWVQRWPDGSLKPDELVDGLQRITAVRRFLANEVPMELTDGTRVYLRDFSEKDQKMLISTTAGPNLVLRYVKYETRADVLRFYIRLNRGGTVHSDAEIDRVKALLAGESS